MSAAGDYLRSLLNTVTTFNQSLSASADAFDIAAGEEPAVEETDDSEDGEPANEPAQRSRSPAALTLSPSFARKKKVVTKRKARRRY